MSREPRVLFTDLDGTLLDAHTYRPGPALEALRTQQAAGVIVVFCSAKTRAEQEHLRGLLDVTGPFIVENGAAVLGDPGLAVEFGMPHDTVRRRLLEAAARTGVAVRGYADMPLEEIMRRTGLDAPAAERARTREFTESFIIEGEAEGDRERLQDALGNLGCRLLVGSRFLTALGDHDKGVAVRHVIDRLGRSGAVRSFGIGDYWNDLDMLAAVDVPMLVRTADGGWAELDLPGLVRLDGVGPHGWVESVGVVLADGKS